MKTLLAKCFALCVLLTLCAIAYAGTVTSATFQVQEMTDMGYWWNPENPIDRYSTHTYKFTIGETGLRQSEVIGYVYGNVYLQINDNEPFLLKQIYFFASPYGYSASGWTTDVVYAGYAGTYKYTATLFWEDFPNGTDHTYEIPTSYTITVQ